MKTNTKFTLIALLLLVSAITLPLKTGNKDAASNPYAYGQRPDAYGRPSASDVANDDDLNPYLMQPSLEIATYQPNSDAVAEKRLTKPGLMGSTYKKPAQRQPLAQPRIYKNQDSNVVHRQQMYGQGGHGILKPGYDKYKAKKEYNSALTHVKKIYKYRTSLNNTKPGTLPPTYVDYADAVRKLMKYANPNCQCGPIEEEQ
ncbi:MAG TPA: hypothetical protein VLG50_08910 [Candidatus Saccharimonadales bacterium]|nr:hypothetical protein [Candidatus Saccharimonadales bacterium]